MYWVSCGSVLTDWPPASQGSVPILPTVASVHQSEPPAPTVIP